MKRLFISFLMVAATATTLFSQDPFCETIVVEGKSSVKMWMDF